MEIRLSVIVPGPVRVTLIAECPPTGGSIRVLRFELSDPQGDLSQMENPALVSFAAKVKANFASVASGIQALDDRITAFNNSPGVLSPEDQAELDSIEAMSSDLAAKANAAVPPVPAA